MEKEMKKSLELILEEISELGDREQIATLARAFWQARGCPEGTAEEDWYLAERELAERKAERRNLAPPLPRFPATSELSQAAEARNLQKSA